MLALTLENAETIAIVAAVVFAVGAIMAFWIMKTIMSKLVTAILLALLAFGVWSQRVSLQDCADKVRSAYERAGTNVTVADTDCTFFGATITVSDPRSSDDT